MESLLRWSIENSAQGNGTAATDSPAPRKDLDPGIIDVILGKPDAEQMKEDLAVAVDDSQSEDDRISALDHFEMLIEQIDNANNIERLGMWPSLHSLVTSLKTPPSVLLQVIWVIGTALQNNPAAQEAYLKYDPVPGLLALLEPSASTPKIRSKVIYAFSGLAKHFAPAVRALDSSEADGWVKLKTALQDPDVTVRRKTAFLINTLLIPPSSSTSGVPSTQPGTTIHANSHASLLKDPGIIDTSSLTQVALKKHGIVDTVIDALVNPVPYGEDGEQGEVDEEFEGRCVALLRTYIVDCKGQVDSKQGEKLEVWAIDKRKQASVSELAERWGVDLVELKNLPGFRT